VARQRHRQCFVVIEMANEHDVKMIEKTLAVLEREREKYLARQAEHADKRKALAYDAHVGDAGASKLLDRLQREAVEIEIQISNIDAARAEGQNRLLVAKAREQQERDAVKAAELRKVLARFTASGREVENALTALVRSSKEMRTALNKLHAGGVANPRHEVVDALGFRALSTRLRETIWGNNFRPLGFDERRDFAGLIASWSAAIEGAITMQLGERTDEAA
jgi:hypothetical protein